MRRGYIDGAWGQVHYRRAGAAGPWVVLFHESPLSSQVYADVLELLAARCQVLAFDTPGYGASDPPPGPDTEIPEYAAVLAEAAARLGVVDAVVGGVHTGASIAIEVASMLAGGCRGVVLSGVPLYDSDERATHLSGWAPDVAMDAEGSQFAWAVDRYRRIWPGLSPQMLHLAVVDAMQVVSRYHWGYRAAFRYDPAPALAALTTPVLLLDPEFDLLADKDERALEIAHDARLVVMPALSGQPHLRDPEGYAREILRFVDEITP